MAESLTIQQALERVRQLYVAGRRADGDALSEQILHAAPLDASVWHQLGLLVRLVGDLHRADHFLTRSLELNPAQPVALSNRSVVRLELGQFGDAETDARAALAMDAGAVSAWINVGNALYRQSRLEEAVEAFREASQLQGENSSIWSNLGAIYLLLERNELANEAFDRALQLDPNCVAALANRGHQMLEDGRLELALEFLNRALLIEPRQISALNNLAQAYWQLGDRARAFELVHQVLQMNPCHAKGRVRLAQFLIGADRIDEAESHLRLALEHDPSYAAARVLWGNILLSRGQAAEAIQSFEKAQSLRHSADVGSKILLGMQYDERVTAEGLLVAHREWAAKFCPPLPTRPSSHWKPGCPLKLGFVSQDLGNHPVGFFLIRIFEAFDRSECELFVYSDRIEPDDLTRRYKRCVPHWRDTRGLSHGQLAEMVGADRIDVLFDLAGHTSGRLQVFARRPAPLQATWAGYVGTTGLEAMDLLIADPYQIAPGTEACYTERILRMPDGYVTFDPPGDAPAVSPLPALASKHFTFGSLNNSAKFAPGVLHVWARILSSLPHSRLLLKFNGLENAILQARILSHFEPRTHARILFEGGSARTEHLARYRDVDLSLDTYPYSGGLTTCESLWMGVPVLTHPGQTFASRHSLSHLSQVGLPEFAAASFDDYVATAIQMANDLSRLAELRQSLRARMLESPLCDGKRFAARLVGELQARLQP